VGLWLSRQSSDCASTSSTMLASVFSESQSNPLSPGSAGLFAERPLCLSTNKSASPSASDTAFVWLRIPPLGHPLPSLSRPAHRSFSDGSSWSRYRTWGTCSWFSKSHSSMLGWTSWTWILHTRTTKSLYASLSETSCSEIEEKPGGASCASLFGRSWRGRAQRNCVVRTLCILWMLATFRLYSMLDPHMWPLGRPHRWEAGVVHRSPGVSICTGFSLAGCLPVSLACLACKKRQMDVATLRGSAGCREGC